jgi:hypothetical protein
MLFSTRQKNIDRLQKMAGCEAYGENCFMHYNLPHIEEKSKGIIKNKFSGGLLC